MRRPTMTGLTAGIACCALLATGFLAFVFFLDRYPTPYFDDCIFNCPALRVADGLSFARPMADSAPHGDAIWAYHSPFFPRLQILTFRLLGVSTFAARIPQFVGGFVALALLCGLLIRHGYPWSAVGLSLTWLGDRALLEILYGRMDGLALLCLVIAAWFFARSRHSHNTGDVFITGLCLGTAVGFHPATSIFAAAVAIAYAILPGLRVRTLAAYAAGGMIPAAGIVYLWGGNLPAALEQFRWHAIISARHGFSDDFRNMVAVLQWSRYWVLTALCVAIGMAGLLVLRVLRSRLPAQKPLEFVLPLFASAGVVTFLGLSQYPYYFVYLSVWTVATVFVFLESPETPPGTRKATAVALILLLVAWLPSAAWNGLRWREAFLFYNRLAPSMYVDQVRTVVPTNARVTVSPSYYMVARPLGRDVVRPPFAEASDLPSDSWLVLSRDDFDALGGHRATGLSNRPLVYDGPVYPAAAMFGSMIILGPSRE